MAGIQKRKAQRRQVRPKVGLAGSSGGGKTYSSLRMAYGYTGDWSKICLIDTEAGRGELYADTTIKGIHIGEYDYIRLDPPFEPRRYIKAIKAAEADQNIEAIIIDSVSHAWAGTGGMLDMKDAYSKNSNENSFTAWRKVTPEHNNLVETILRSRCAVFVTVRSKTEYVIEDVNGKKVPRKIGMAPVFRDGLEYEFTVFMEMSQDHYANASKDNTGVFEGVPFIPTDEHGKALRKWLETGKGDSITPSTPAPQPQQPTVKTGPKREPMKPADKLKVSDAEFKKMAQEGEKALDQMSGGGTGIDVQLHSAWDALGTPDNKRQQQLSKPDLDKEVLLSRLNAEVERRRGGEAGQSQTVPELKQEAPQETPASATPPPQPPQQIISPTQAAATAPVGAFF